MKLLLCSAAAVALFAAAPAAFAQTAPDQGMAEMDHSAMDHSQHGAAAAPAAPAMDHSSHQGMAGMEGMEDHASHGMAEMTGNLGAYAINRDASGTAWQPDVSPHGGFHTMSGDWTVMAHATLNGVYSWQEGPRGDEKTFASGMIMASAKRTLANSDSLTLRAMLSPDPFMGAEGYPLLLATGETANGVTHLVDRQHPHDLFMELSATYAHQITERDSVFVYAGLPGEPAFGPPAFMHRLSIMDSPEAPISHHWLDSTHITFGVVTAGFVHDTWKIEASAFKGREPDEHRYDIETPKLDSAAVRLSWNPTERWSLQASWAHLTSPEALEPDHDETRWSASAIYTVPVGEHGFWSTTAAWGRKEHDGEALDGFALESAVSPDGLLTVFGRAERVDNAELVLPVEETYTVGKVSLGAVRDFRVADQAKIGLGALYAWNFVPDALEPAYGGDPNGAMVFVRLKLGG